MSTGLEYGPGSVIEYTAFGGVKRRVTVDERDPDIKHGRPGFAGTDQDGTSVWGYDDQITRVLPSRAARAQRRQA